MEGFIKSIEKIGDDHEDEDPAAMTLITRGLGHGAMFACSYGDAIIDSLQNICCVLDCIAVRGAQSNKGSGCGVFSAFMPSESIHIHLGELPTR